MVDTEILTALGLWSLFLSAFFAGTVLAFGSEAVLVAVLLLGVSPIAAVGVASLGNTLGALTVYAIGRAIVGQQTFRDWILGHPWLARFQRVDPDRLTKARKLLDRWGPVALLLSWLPAIGDVLVLAAGFARLQIVPVIIFVAVGKVARYGALVWLVGAIG